MTSPVLPPDGQSGAITQEEGPPHFTQGMIQEFSVS